MNISQNIKLWLIFLIAGLVIVLPRLSLAGKNENAALKARWTFDKDKIGSVPKGWQIAETRGRGKTATWKVIKEKTAPSPSNVVAITENKNHGSTFNLLLAKNTKYKNLKITVMIKAIAGKEDQGGGPIWRAKDANNYYVCRWNPLEDNFRLYYVKNGNRRQIGSANIKANPKVWHKIEIEQKGNKIEAEFDGKELIEVKDSTFTDAGMIGLWVKSDGKSEFDNVKVVELNKETDKSDDNDDNK